MAMRVLRELWFGFLVVAACAALPALAQEEQPAWPLLLGPDIPYELFVDRQRDRDLAAVKALDDNAWELEDRPLVEGYTRDVHWLRFRLPDEALTPPTLWLEVSPSYLDHLDLFYQPDPDSGEWRQISGGDRLPAAERPIDFRHMVFPIENPANLGTLYLRLESTSSHLLYGKLWTPQAFAVAQSRINAAWGLYFGFAAFSVLLAIALALLTKDRLLWSVAALGVSYVFIASMHGFTGWLLFPTLPQVADPLVGISLILAWCALLWLGREALELYERIPWMDRLIKSLIGLIALCLISIPLELYSVGIQLVTLFGEVGKWALLGASIWLWRHVSHRYALFAVPFSLHAVTGTISVLAAQGFYPFAEINYLLWQYAMVVLMLAVIGLAVERLNRAELEKRDRATLARELELERESSYRQRQFVDMVSHEFRNPLAIIDAVTNNLQIQPDLPAKWREDKYQKILRASGRIAMLMNNCLVDDRIYRDKLYFEPLDVVTLVNQAAVGARFGDTHEFELIVNNRTQESDSEEEMIEIEADSALLRIAFTNVLSNADKYSEPGVIRASIERKNDRVRVRVSNQGPAITEDVAERLFDRYFSRHPEGVPRKTSAHAGLGLYIAREVALEHGGDLRLLPYQDGWVSFEFDLPVVQADKSRAG